MFDYIISEYADEDIKFILSWTQDKFGITARERYELLLMLSILDIANNPERAGIVLLSEIEPGACEFIGYATKDAT